MAITFTVKIGDDEPQVHTVNATLRSVNDCPFGIKNDDGGVTDVSYMFAAYVNEQHPFVDKVLRKALDDGVVNSFTGYQSGKPADVYRQVYALWNALAERDVRYSSITKSAAASETVYCQHVRLIDESINNGQANCVDGAVLFASLLRKIDIEPVLVSLPHHCYVAFYLDRERTQLVGLETTLLGEQLDEDAEYALPGEENVVDEQWQATSSWRSFARRSPWARRTWPKTRRSSTRTTPTTNWSASNKPARTASCRSASTRQARSRNGRNNVLHFRRNGREESCTDAFPKLSPSSSSNWPRSRRANESRARRVTGRASVAASRGRYRRRA